MKAISAQHQFLIQKMKLVNKINSEITRKFRLGEVRDATLLADRATSHREWRLMNFKPGQSISQLMQGLPVSWTVLQISCHASPRHSRFKNTKQNVANKESNPNLFMVRMSNSSEGSCDAIPLTRIVLSREGQGTASYLHSLQDILKVRIFMSFQQSTDMC